VEVAEPAVSGQRREYPRVSNSLCSLQRAGQHVGESHDPHHDNLYEVALWADMLRVQGDELFYACMVDNQAIVIPETIDAIRALTGTVKDSRGVDRQGESGLYAFDTSNEPARTARPFTITST
jgi:glyceraldehyde-3-phosphate dehydrogenase (NAD(P))